MTACSVQPFPSNGWKGPGVGQRAFQGWELGMFLMQGPSSYDTDGSVADFTPWYGSVLTIVPGCWIGSGGLDFRRLPVHVNDEALGTMAADAVRMIFLETAAAAGEFRQVPNGTNLVNFEFLALVIGTPPGQVLTGSGELILLPQD